jgi:tRNA uridine 5-carbamoylmethylation protein Kti12
MVKERDYYWAVTKEEFLERLKALEDPYSLSIWNYLQAYIIRGKTEIPLWKECYNLYEAIGLLATSISINKISRNLNIGTDKTKRVLKHMDGNDYIVKYASKNKNDVNNTNIYIMGFINSGFSDSNIQRQENYFVNKINNMRSNDRERITKLFDKQLKTTKSIKELTVELREIQDYLFRGRA